MEGDKNMNKPRIAGYARINKTQARHAYNAGKDVYILPCKVRFNNMWFAPYIANKTCGEAFITIVNQYSYYNCNYNELGKYPAYYVKEA